MNELDYWPHQEILDETTVVESRPNSPSLINCKYYENTYSTGIMCSGLSLEKEWQANHWANYPHLPRKNYRGEIILGQFFDIANHQLLEEKTSYLNNIFSFSTISKQFKGLFKNFFTKLES